MNMCEKCGVRYAPKSAVLDRGICRACASPHMTAAERWEMDELDAVGTTASILDLTQALLGQADGVEEPEPERRDFFISYHAESLDHAVRVDELVRRMGKSTYFFRHGGGSGNFLKAFQDALERSDRVICILSRGYFESQYCRDELDAFWMLPDRDEERRIVFWEVEPSRIPKSYGQMPTYRLTNLKAEAYATKLQQAIESTGRQYAEYGYAHAEKDEPWIASLASMAHIPRPHWSPALAMAALCLMAVGYYLTYFQFGPRGVWDMREAATYAAVGRDISLPWSWTIATADLREYVGAEDPEAVDYWRRPNGRTSEFQRPGQFLQPVGLSMLKSTLPESSGTGSIEEGIAQFRAVFTGGTLKLLADAQADGEAYRGFRMENDGVGGMVAFYFEKRAGGGEAFTQLARKQIGTAASLHDIGLSKKDGLLTLWHNRAVMATWPPRESRVLAWKGGAFGLAANGSSRVKLFHWSLRANRQEGALSGRLGRRRVGARELESLLSFPPFSPGAGGGPLAAAWPRAR